MFVERETSQFAGFMNPLVKCLMNAHKIKDFSEEEFNVNSDTYFFLRESHEDNPIYTRRAVRTRPRPIDYQVIDVTNCVSDCDL